jgi:hypothetical protein
MFRLISACKIGTAIMCGGLSARSAAAGGGRIGKRKSALPIAQSRKHLSGKKFRIEFYYYLYYFGGICSERNAGSEWVAIDQPSPESHCPV